MRFRKAAILPLIVVTLAGMTAPAVAHQPELDRLAAELDAIFERIIAAIGK